MQVTTLAPDLHLAVGDTYGANSLILVNGREALLIETMASVADAARLRDHLAMFGLDVRFIIQTHYFSDHMAGLQLFPRAQIIAHRNYLQTFRSEQFRTPEEEAHFVEPTMLVSDELTVRWGRFTPRIFHNPGHTASTLAVDIPEADLVHAADTVVGNIVYFAYSAPETFYPALERIGATQRSQLLTSHGAVGAIDAVSHARFYLDALRDVARAVDTEELRTLPLERCLSPHVAPSDFERIFHDRNVKLLADKRARFAA